MLEEAERLVQADVLREKEDTFYLTFQELDDVARRLQAAAQEALRMNVDFSELRSSFG